MYITFTLTKTHTCKYKEMLILFSDKTMKVVLVKTYDTYVDGM